MVDGRGHGLEVGEQDLEGLDLAMRLICIEPPYFVSVWPTVATERRSSSVSSSESLRVDAFGSPGSESAHVGEGDAGELDQHVRGADFGLLSEAPHLLADGRLNDGIHRYLARGPLAALRVIDLRQSRDQRFETCLGSGWHGVYRPALAVRDNAAGRFALVVGLAGAAVVGGSGRRSSRRPLYASCHEYANGPARASTPLAPACAAQQRGGVDRLHPRRARDPPER